jgi:predicted GNAT family acetyltransferase
MRYEQIQDPGVFRERTAPLLIDEARHNLMLGILGTLLRTPEAYDYFRMFLVSDNGAPVAAALMTAPYNLILADTDEEGVDALIAGLQRDQVAIPGAIGNRPTIDHFARRWPEVTGVGLRRTMEQGVFAVAAVAEVKAPSGEPRVAMLEDLDLISTWMGEFAAEALPEEPHDEERMRKAIERRLIGESAGAYWLWVDLGEVVALTGHGNPTGRGIRIGPVYTPPELRGRGYATGLVAAQSQWLLDNGYDFCFLYTDLANPTSNRIYERIGYRQIAESASYVVAGD